MRNRNLLVVAFLASVILAACSDQSEVPTATETHVDEPTQAPTAVEVPTEEPTVTSTATQVPTEEPTAISTEAETHAEEEIHSDEEAAIEGLALFRSVGCAACHGQDGEGGTGPAIAGHTADQVRRQVRTPTGDVMPAYSQEQLSDDQLDLIIAWVESLGPATAAHDHGEEADDAHAEAEGFETDAPVTAHLRLAFFAAKDGNAHDAEHHLEDAIALLEDEHAKEQAEEILTSIQTGADLHDVEHEMEHLMGDMEAGETDGPIFHMQLVLDSLTLGDPEAAGHHLEHYADLVEDADLVAMAEELQAHLAEGELHVVEEEVQRLLAGQEPDH